MSTVKRDIYWDIVKAIAIFLVVLGHSLQYLCIDKDYCHTDYLFNFIYSFHMPLFMVVSGYFGYSSLSKPILGVLKRKFIQIMIPAITWSLLISIMVYIINPEKSYSFSLGYCYLNALLGCYVIFLFGNFLKQKSYYLVYPYILILYVFGLYLNISHTISMIPFFGLGLLIRKYPSFLEDKYKLIFSVTFPLIILISILYPSQLYNMYSHPFEHSWGAYCTYIVRLLIGTIGTLSVLSLVKIIYSTFSIKDSLLLQKIGMCTLGIYLIQRLVLEIIGSDLATLLYIHMDFERTTITDVIFDLLIAPTISILVIILCVYIIKLIRKNIYTKHLLLGEQ